MSESPRQTNDLCLRVDSLGRLVIKLREAVYNEANPLPHGRPAVAVARTLDSICDEVERLVWLIGGRPSA